MDPQLLSLLRCPRTGGRLRLASESELICINAEIRAKQGPDQGHQEVNGELEQSLICDSAKLCYPVRDGLPVLLPNEALDLPESLDTSMAKLEKSSHKTVILDELDQNRSIDQEIGGKARPSHLSRILDRKANPGGIPAPLSLAFLE